MSHGRLALMRCRLDATTEVTVYDLDSGRVLLKAFQDVLTPELTEAELREAELREAELDRRFRSDRSGRYRNRFWPDLLPTRVDVFLLTEHSLLAVIRGKIYCENFWI